MGKKEQQPKHFLGGVNPPVASIKGCDSPASPPRIERRGNRAVANGGRAALRRRSGDGAVNAISFNVGDELVERIARRAAELVAEQSSEPVDDGWLRGAERIAAYIDAPRSRVYGLVSAKRIPVHHDGSALIARRSELDKWLLRGGGVRP
jgi:hypothetical protein